jgi:hypothetical protein
MLITIQSIIFIGYVVFLWIRFKGPLTSISESWYKLPDNLKILFTLWCWALGFATMFHGTLWFFLAGGSLFFVGVCTRYKSLDKYTGYIHSIGALSFIVFNLIGICIKMHSLGAALLFLWASFVIYLWNIPNKIWWNEIAAGIVILISLIILYGR